MSDELFVPDGFTVPDGLTTREFRLVPLGPQHNESDYAAWTASVDHIRATPGFDGRSWPHEMSLDDNLRDLEQHARDFAGRRGFTYTVLSADAAELRDFTRQALRSSKTPDRFWFLDALPRTETGKLLRRLVPGLIPPAKVE